MATGANQTELPPGFAWLGDRAIRFARPPGSVRALVHELRTWPDVVDVVVARDDVALYFAATPAPLADRIARLGDLVEPEERPRVHVLRAVYDGPDLDEVCKTTGMSRDDVIVAHRSSLYTVALMGFAPGFAYLDGLDPLLELPRRLTPRPRVPANAIAIAGMQTAVYPFACSGGWNLIGRVVNARVFDERGPLLALGDQVRFTT